MNYRHIHPCYPDAADVDGWADALFAAACETPATAEILGGYGFHNACGPMHMYRSALIKFSQPGMRDFYGMFHPALNGPRPLVVHLPGYGSELSTHHDVAAANYNLLELVPMGYWTPNGFAEELRHPKTGAWPVLTESVIDRHGPESYWGWMINAIGAIRWAMQYPTVMPDRVSFFGTSQGGGTALLLGSIFRDHGTRCVCADEPFLTHYPLSDFEGAYDVIRAGMDEVGDEIGWNNLGYIDSMCHAHRMNYPVLLTLGTGDVVCPPKTIRALFDALDTDKMLFSMRGRGHGHQFEFIRHVLTYLELYA